MKVRIVKCTHNIQWYANQIGSIISVKPHSDGINYAANFVGESTTHFMYAEDCEIIEADEPKPDPFDLERALNGEKVVKNGMIGEFKFSFINGNFAYFCFLFTEGDLSSCLFYCGNTYDWMHHPNGSVYGEGNFIQMAPREPEYQTVWVNLYRNNSTIKNSGFRTGAVSLSKDRSLEISLDNNSDYIGTFPITFKKP